MKISKKNSRTNTARKKQRSDNYYNYDFKTNFHLFFSKKKKIKFPKVLSNMFSDNHILQAIEKNLTLQNSKQEDYSICSLRNSQFHPS